MKPDEFISKYSKNLQPVHPIGSIKKNIFIFLIISIISIISYVLIKSEFLRYIYIPEFLYEDFVVVFILVISLILVLRESTPGFLIKRKYYYLPFGLLGIWLLSLFARYFLQEDFSQEIKYVYHDCITDTIFMSLASIFTIVFIVNKRVPFRRELIGFWIFLICSSGSALGVSVLCPDERSSHLIVFHFIPVLGMSLAGLLLGKYLFRDLI